MQTSVYSMTLCMMVLTLILSIVSMNQPTWIRFETPPTRPFYFSTTYGLFERCDKSNLYPQYRCRPFPLRDTDCRPGASSATAPATTLADLALPHPSAMLSAASSAEEATRDPADDGEAFGFCELWDSAGYTSQLSVMVGVAAVLCLLAVLVGNEQRKAAGWKVVAGLMGTHCALQVATFSIIFHLFSVDERFLIGSKLSTAAFLCVAAFAVDAIVVVALSVAGLVGVVAISREGGYHEIAE